MPHVSTLRDCQFAEQANDIRGTTLFGRNDEKLGTLHDVIFEHATGQIEYVVVDTGGWLRHKYFLVPAQHIRPYEKHEDHFYVDLTKEQVESFPPYNERLLEKKTEWKAYEQSYRQAWSEVGIMHRKDSPDRIITPPPDESPAEPVGHITGSSIPGYQPEVTPERLESVTPLPRGPGGGMMVPEEKTAISGAVAPWSSQNRWEAFEGSLRRHLPEIQKDCPSCGPDQRDQERSRLRKAG